MRSSASIARHFIVLALTTIFLINSLAFSAYGVRRLPTVTPTLPPTPSPTLPGTNGRIAYVVEPFQTFTEIYSMNPDGSDPVRLTNNTVADYTPVYSPGGTHIVFVSHRNNNEDIYLMNADGSGEVRLTTDAAADNSPAWSADGTKIAFVSMRAGNEQIFTMNADGSNQVQLTSFGVNRYPTWSPDGTKFAFSSFRLGVDSYELFTMDADGSNPVAITHNSVAESEPGWSPAGDNIVFTRAVGNPNAPNYEIFVINPDGSNEIQLTDNNPRQDVNPTWSPDATKIAFSSNRDNVFGHDVFVMDANGGNLTNITVGNGARGSQPSWGTAPIATPTPTPTATPTPTPVYNGRIAFVSTHAADGNIDIYVMRPDGTEQTRITNDPAGESDPDWSPDGTKIAFASTRDDTSGLGESAIYIMNADGTNQTRLTDLSDVSLFTGTPAFSPDGTKIAYQKGIPNSGNGYDINVYVMNVDGTNRVQLTNIDGFEPTWSPDGSKIAFRSARSFANEIWVMNADGSNQVNLTNNNASNFSPAWSPDGTKIAYGSYLDGNTDIFVMTADGSNQTRVNNDPSSNEFGPAWSPDGTRIVYFSDLGVYPLSDIYVINADGTGRIQLTTDPDVGENWPAWQPLSAPLPDPTPTPPADLSVTADAQPYEVAPGGTLVSTSVATNNGPAQANEVRVGVIVPPDVAVDSINAPGYRNDNPVTFNIAVGASNNFSPGNQNRGQTTAFQTGTVANAFTVTWDGSSLTWTVKGPDGQTRKVIAKKP
jgi:Tol biopolymer transport system component